MWMQVQSVMQLYKVGMFTQIQPICDPILENPYYRAKYENGVITTTGQPVLQRTEWWVKRGDQALRCHAMTLNASRFRLTLFGEKPVRSCSMIERG